MGTKNENIPANQSLFKLLNLSAIYAMPIFPSELLSLLGSSLFGGLMRVVGRSMESRHQERMLSFQMAMKPSAIIRPSRIIAGPYMFVTRRVIALLAVLFIIVFPKVVAVFMPEVPVHVGYSEMTDGFWIFASAMEKIKWVKMQGLVITPLDTHLLSAVIGLYFGSALVGNAG
jgi:hypothetical protein